MQRRRPQPLLLIDSDRSLFDAVNRVLERLGRWRPLVLIPQLDAARQYLRDAFLEDRIPDVTIIRAREQDDIGLSLLDWFREQPEPLRSAYILVVSDAVVREAESALDVWMENALAEALTAPVVRPVSGEGVDAHFR